MLSCWAVSSRLTVSSPTELSVTKGFCAKDKDVTSIDDCPVTIQIVNDFTVDLTDPSNYIIRIIGEPQEMEAPFPATGYLVLTYQYQKLPDPPVAYVKILKHTADFDPMYHLFLARVVFSGPMEVTAVYPTDPNTPYSPTYPLTRQILNLYETYNDDKARAADALNPITNHLTDPANPDKVVTLNSSGIPTLVSKAAAGFYNSVHKFAGDYAPTPFSPLTLEILHNLGHYPLVQVLRVDNTDPLNPVIRVIEPVDIQHNNLNTFVLAFDTELDSGSPEVYVLYI